MLKTFIPAEESYNTFTRPAIYDSLRQMLKFYGLESNAQIYYNGEYEISKLVGSNTSDSPLAGRYTDGIYRNKLFIVPEIEPTEFNSGYGNQRRSPTELSSWSDGGELPLILTPAYEGRKITVNVNAMFNSRATAQQFVNRINRLQANQVTAFNISANVHLVINPAIIEFFKSIHALLVKGDPTTPELADWFDAGCQTPVTKVTNLAGNLPRMVTPVKLENIGVYFGEPTVRQARQSSAYGKYEVEVSYYFYFQEFLGWELQFPLNVYQEEIPARFIPAPQEKHTEPFNRRVAPETAFAIGLGSLDRLVQTPYYLKLPAHDPWAWKRQAWMQPIIQARLALQDKETQALGNIFAIPGFEWNEAVKAYMLRRHDVMTTHNASPFLVQVFSNDRRVHADRLSMDAEGLVTLTGAPLLKNTYRIVVVLNWAIRDYFNDFWDDMWANPKDRPVLESIFPAYDWNQFPGPWVDYIDQVRGDIAKGYGIHPPRINTYMMNYELRPYVLIKEKS